MATTIKELKAVLKQLRKDSLSVEKKCNKACNQEIWKLSIEEKTKFHKHKRKFKDTGMIIQNLGQLYDDFIDWRAIVQPVLQEAYFKIHEYVINEIYEYYGSTNFIPMPVYKTNDKFYCKTVKEMTLYELDDLLLILISVKPPNISQTA